MSSTELPVVLFETAGAWQSWLDSNHRQPTGAWLKIAKKASGLPSVSYDEAVEIALCYGWIDGQKKAFDDKYWIQKFTPRRPRSIWSLVNTERVKKLIASGKMQPAGLAQVEAAKADGRWDAAYAPQSSAEMPADFIAALEQNPKAKQFYATLNSSNRYAIFFRLNDAKRPETRAARLAKFIDQLNNGQKIIG